MKSILHLYTGFVRREKSYFYVVSTACHNPNILGLKLRGKGNKLTVGGLPKSCLLSFPLRLGLILFGESLSCKDSVSSLKKIVCLLMISLDCDKKSLHTSPPSMAKLLMYIQLPY